MLSTGRFADRRAAVTGGGSGIGRATALRLAGTGATVLIGDVDEAGGQAPAETADGRMAFRCTDVTSADDSRALIEAADIGGRIDILFSNAGAGGTKGGVDELEADDRDRTQTLFAALDVLT